MPQVTQTRWPRVAVAFLLYAALVTIGGVLFTYLRVDTPGRSSMQYAYSLGGPALSLFTHMSYILFALQSLLFIPWLLLGALKKNAMRLAIAGFGICWIGVGWYMHDLF